VHRLELPCNQFDRLGWDRDQSAPHRRTTKIADILTAIDAVTAQVVAMGRFKKGLLQQMFV
jgi:hypothetical protein